MNNYWYTNFKAYQEGIINFHYFITSGKEITNSSAEKFSLSLSMPLFYQLIGDYFKIDRENLSITGFKKAEDGNGFILRIKEWEGMKTTFNLECPGFKKVKVFLSSPIEEKIKEIKGHYSIGAFEILTLYLLIEK